MISPSATARLKPSTTGTLPCGPGKALDRFQISKNFFALDVMGSPRQYGLAQWGREPHRRFWARATKRLRVQRACACLIRAGTRAPPDGSLENADRDSTL